MASVGNLEVTIGAKITDLQNNIKKVQSLMDDTKTKTSSLGNTITNAFKFAGGAAIFAGITSGLKSIATAGIEFDSAVQQNSAALTTLLGSASKAKDMLAQLTTFAANTPFEIGDVTKASQTLLTFGISAEKILPTIKMLGDASLGNKEKFDGMTLAFAQIQSTGRLMGQDLLYNVAC